MIYNPEKTIDCERAIEKLKYYITKKQPFELKRMAVSKSSNQNSYFHLLIGWFALEYGETSEYVKQEIIKKIVCPEIFKSEFINKKTGEIREDWKSWSSLTKDEATYVIDKFKHYASKEAGIYLPEPTNIVALREIQIQIKNHQHYL